MEDEKTVVADIEHTAQDHETPPKHDEIVQSGSNVEASAVSEPPDGGTKAWL